MYKKTSKRDEQSRQSRMALYESASRLFAERGFNNVTVEELCADANLSTGAFYHYFKSKTEILTIYQVQLDEQYAAFYENTIKSDECASLLVPEKLRKMLKFILGCCVDRGVEYERIVYSHIIMDTGFSSAMIAPDRGYYTIMHELIASGQQEGSITDDITAEQIVDDITKLCRGCIVDWCVNGGKPDIYTHCERFIASYIRGIAK